MRYPMIALIALFVLSLSQTGGLVATVTRTMVTSGPKSTDNTLTGNSFAPCLRQTLEPTGPQDRYLFGSSIKLSGDTMVIAAPGELFRSGASYVFSRQVGIWSLQQKILSPFGLDMDAKFGESVDIDGETIVIGEPGRNIAWVFRATDTGWNVNGLLAEASSSVSEFGKRVSISGDRVAVTEPAFFGETLPPEQCPTPPFCDRFISAVHVFRPVDGAWSLEQTLIPRSEPDPAVVYDPIVISEDELITSRRSALVFRRDGSIWSEQQELLAPAGQTSNESLALDGHFLAYQLQGVVSVFEKTGEQWNLRQTLDLNDPDQHAKTVALSGDKLLVGTDDGAYVFRLSGGNWIQDHILFPPRGIGDGAVAVSEDTIVIGSADEFGASGRVYVYTADSTPPVILLRADPITLFPNDHKYWNLSMVSFIESASDNCDSSVNFDSVVITQVTSDEPDNAPGNSDGNTLNDIVIAPDCKSVQLRAERDGNRDGRVYTITLRVRDALGNTTTGTTKVTVPLSQNGNPAIENAPQHTVTSGCP